jgi:NTP pyrophosphatase (non-canonical NTP hydrolase)
MEGLKERLRKFNDERNWHQFHTPRNLATSISLEASEILEKFQWKLDDNVTPEEIEELKDELADVLIYTLQLSMKLDIDLIAVTNAKIDKNAVKYPVEKSKDQSTKYTKLE